MKRTKWLFLLLATLFFLILGIIGWDIARKTTFPGKPATEVNQNKD